MTIAEIHGKSPLTTSEDMLTANVFTAFRYLPAGSGIIGFLRTIKGVADVIPEPGSKATAEYFFWPVGLTREPDVLLEIQIDGRAFHVIVEAKYFSGPSDYELIEMEIDAQAEAIRWGNQLADQLRELAGGTYNVWHDGRRERHKRLESRPQDRLLLYLTAHALQPQAELGRSALLCPEEAHRLYWSNWYHIYDYLEGNRTLFNAFPFNHVVDDLFQLFKLKAFSSFQGVIQPARLKSPDLDGRFWQGVDTLLPVYDGVRLPPSIAVPKASFWQGRDTPLPVFYGVRFPVNISIQEGAAFWQEH